MSRPPEQVQPDGIAPVEDLIARGWSAVEPSYLELAVRPLPGPAIPGWLAEWSGLEDQVEEARHVALIAWAADTANPVHERAHRRFGEEIIPRAAEHRTRLAARLLETGYTRPDLDHCLRRFQADLRLFRPQSASLLAEVESLGITYQKALSALHVTWDGRTLALSQLGQFHASTDRTVREAAWRAETDALLARRDEFADLFDRLLAARTRIAQAAGFRDYRDYAFVERHRFDYTPADCERLRRAIRDIAVPALARMREARRRSLGLTTLRPWDLDAPPAGGVALRPQGTPGELPGRARVVFQALDPTFADWFDLILDAGLHDLEARPGKAPGAFAANLYARRLPFLFLNAAGAAADVTSLLHEAGHAFHDLAARHHPLFWHRLIPTESAELASMTLELLALPHVTLPGGLHAPEAAGALRRLKLEEVLVLLCQVAAVDEFQHWIYSNPAGGDAEARDRAWLEIRQVYEPVVDWAGLERERSVRWYRQRHIFRFPFYYIEYALAQQGALQIWHGASENMAEAVRRYRLALQLGATAPLPEVYQAAGARLIFDADRLRPLVERVEAEWAREAPQ